MSIAQEGRSDLELASLRRDRELALAREAAFEVVDAHPDLSRHHPVLLDELDLLFTEEDEGFLATS
jgi:ATP-dependent DNA helicase RecG